MKRFISLLFLLLLPLCACAAGEARSLTVTAFAANGGDSLLLSFDGSAVLIDTGGASGVGDILDRLREQSVSRLSALILTQYTPEHAGGAAALLESLPVEKLYLPAYAPDSDVYRAVQCAAADAGCTTETVTEDRTVRIGTAVFEFWASSVAFDGKNDSEQSLAAAMAYGEHRLVFLSDADGAWLDRLCYGNYNLTCDILKMPQHGAWVAHDFELIAFSFARFAILTDSPSAPADSRTVNGLRLIGCQVYQTKDGQIRLHSDGKDITVP